MPLEPIASRDRKRRRTRRALLAGMIGTGVGALLTACSSGSSREAEKGRRQDAERTSVVDSLQATESAKLLNEEASATPPAEPGN